MASRGVNKVILIGNLGADPDVRYTPGGSAVTKIRVATSESWRDKQTGENQERTEWHRVTLFGRLGEVAGEYLRKGAKVYLEGRLQTSKYQGPDGSDRYSTDIIANEMQMLDGRGDGGGMSRPAGDRAAQLAASSGGNPGADQGGGQAAAGAAPAQGGAFDDFDDDIPF